MGIEGEALLAHYCPAAETKPASCTKRVRWSAIKAELNGLIPKRGRVLGEDRLKWLKKLHYEIVTKVIMRFITNAELLVDQGGIQEQVTTRSFFKALPKQLQLSLALLDFDQCTLSRLEKRAVNYCDWLSIMRNGVCSKETLRLYGDRLSAQDLRGC